ncbi:4Fe-4S binding protein [PVC group bacterium]|nr:4Fe-4S binding protein [PVC group bacterium]
MNRFPRPDFDTDYVLPLTTVPESGSHTEMLALVILILAMSATAYLAIKRRSRKGVVAIMLFSLLYFGFIRDGCTCAVGSLQNVTLALSDSGYGVPLIVLGFFLLPLLFTLFFGRVFCGSVCPLGAIQDVAVVKPIKVPNWLEHCLGLIPYLYLGLAVLFAATGSAFIICRYDPFVAIFRFGGSFNMLLLGAAFLITGIFVARPYCRYLCPYGVLLRWMSYFSKYHLTITPTDCIQCRLCEDACPFGAINKPTASKLPEERSVGIRRLAIMIVILPLMILLSGWCGWHLDGILSKMHPTVQTAEQVKSENLGETKTSTWQSKAFRESGKPISELYEDALTIRQHFKFGGAFLGGFLALVLSIKMISLSMWRKRENYEMDKMKCLSCARCLSYCPQKKK